VVLAAPRWVHPWPRVVDRLADGWTPVSIGMSTLATVLAFLALLSFLLTLWQWAVARRFPLHRRLQRAEFAPAVTLLKPLKGCDAETESCLRSWMAQEYPGELQILFGVTAADDPACAVVRRLLKQFSGCDAELIVCPQRLGPNAKVSKLAQLEPKAKHEIVVVSDADTRIPQDFLVNVVEPFQNPEAGLVNCFYQLADPTNLAMRWEALSTNADFWSQVLQSVSLRPMDFALGAVMATTRRRLTNIGGFGALAEHLADDYELGRRIARAGGRIVLSPLVVECRSSPMTWSEVWVHQLRWARTIRICQPVPYFFSILSNATLWPLLWLAAAPTALVAGAAALCWLTRAATALYCERKLTGALRWDVLWLVPLKDLLQVALWFLAFAGRQVTWRGERFRVVRGGRLLRV
jgi:ceramide glucosyltransferase